MSNVKRVYVEKKADFAVQAKELRHEIKHYLGVPDVTGVRVLFCFDIVNDCVDSFEIACFGVFAEAPVVILYNE